MRAKKRKQRQGERRPEQEVVHLPAKSIRVPVPPARPAHLDPVKPQTRVADFEIVRWLGAGAFGAVYLARQLESGVPARRDEPVVLKICTLRDPLNEERFGLEAPILQRLNNPHIVKVQSSGVLPEIGPYIAMEWGGDRTLQQVLAWSPGARIPWPRALRIADQIADALDEMGRNGVVHNDLKPENILLSDRAGMDWIKVIDFGVARRLDSQGTSEAFRGTHEYGSPEQARGHLVDARSDIYAFGVILYQMLSGKFPFPERGPSALRARVERLPDSIATYVQDLPDSIGEILRRCLEVDVHKRFQTGAEIRHAIQKVETPAPNPVEAPP